MQVSLRRYGSRGIGVGGDETFINWPLPNECTLTKLIMDVHVLSLAPVDIEDVVMYGCEGWILMTDSPGDFDAPDTLWDSYVPKDNDVESLDTSQTAIADSITEAGQVNLAQIFDHELLGPERIFQREKLISMANRPVGFFNDPNTPFDNLFIPTDNFSVSISKRYRAKDDAGILFGLGAPAWDVAQDDDVIDSSNVQGFYILRYLKEHMQRAAIDLMNLHELGAESPYDVLLDFIADTLEKVVTKTSTGAFTGIAWEVFGKGVAQITVPGDFNVSAIGPDSEAR